MAVPIHEPGQQVGNLVASANVPHAARDTAASSAAVSRDCEVTFSGKRPEQIQFPLEEGCTCLEGVASFRPRHRIGSLVTGLRNNIEAVVAGVLELAVVTADQCDTPQKRGIAVYDSKLRAEVHTIKRWRIPVFGANKADSCFVQNRWVDCVGPSHSRAPGVIKVDTRAETRGKGCQTWSFGLINAAAADTDKNGVGSVYDVISAHIKVIPSLVDFPDVPIVLFNRVATAVDRGRTVRCWKRIDVSEANRVLAARWNHVAGKRKTCRRIQYIGGEGCVRAGICVANILARHIGIVWGSQTCLIVRAGNVKQFRKVSVPHRSGRHCGGVIASGDSLSQALIVNEEEQFVLDDGTA